MTISPTTNSNKDAITGLPVNKNAGKKKPLVQMIL